MDREVLDWLNTCCEDDVINGAVWDKGRDGWQIWNEEMVIEQFHELNDPVS